MGNEQERYAEELLHEARMSMAPITHSLLAAGFGDVQDDEVLVLLALRMTDEKSAGSLLRTVEVSDQVAGSATEKLLSYGYLERGEYPDQSAQSPVELCERGDEAFAVIAEELKAQRWATLPFRPGDIVICSPPRSGTTWTQMICALLIFQTPDLPAPLPELSPWLETEVPQDTRDKLFAQLADQQHRRFMKSHLPLDQMAIDPRVTYIALARHPLDMMLSRYQISHVSAERDRQLEENSRPALREWLLGCIDDEGFAILLKTLSSAWERRDDPNVMLLRYEDMVADLEGQMRRLAARLDITVSEMAWPGLVKAATFDQMRAVADRIQPGPNLKDPEKFFWQGKPGLGRALLTDDDLAWYDERAAQLAPADLLAWLSR
jgi:aryl sulfotransferase